jgi:hypothetical protein
VRSTKRKADKQIRNGRRLNYSGDDSARPAPPYP